ncbi:MAG: hypothetical protein PF693_03525 [Spirochaetia bacterium]|jgi:exonuclease VII large subunit|nr:hypothetical protein [Spirochaetia bacterium]
MEAMVEVLEHELEEAFEVKNKKSLHRYVILLTENIVKKDTYEKEQLKVSSQIQNLTEIVKQGFQRMDERFEAVDKRFEAVDKRFEEMLHYMDKRFEDSRKSIDERLKDSKQDMDKRFTQLQWTMGLGFTILAALMGIFNFY